MAIEGLQRSLGWFGASTSFASTDQYSLIKFSSSGTIGNDVRISDTQGEFCHGVLQDLGSGSSGSAVAVCVNGVTKVRVGTTHGAIALGTILYSGGAGSAHTATSSGYYPIGYALDSIAADTTGIISMYFQTSLNTRST